MAILKSIIKISTSISGMAAGVENSLSNVFAETRVEHGETVERNTRLKEGFYFDVYFPLQPVKFTNISFIAL